MRACLRPWVPGVVRGPQLGAPPSLWLPVSLKLCVPLPHSEGQVASMDSAVAPLLCAFQSIPFGCADVWNSAVPCCAGQKYVSLDID